MILIVFLIIAGILVYRRFEPYIDIIPENEGKKIIIWYFDKTHKRTFIQYYISKGRIYKI